MQQQTQFLHRKPRSNIREIHKTKKSSWELKVTIFTVKISWNFTLCVDVLVVIVVKHVFGVWKLKTRSYRAVFQNKYNRSWSMHIKTQKWNFLTLKYKCSPLPVQIKTLEKKTSQSKDKNQQISQPNLLQLLFATLLRNEMKSDFARLSSITTYESTN